MSQTDPFAGQWRDLPTPAADDSQTSPADKQIQRIQARAAAKRADRHDAISTWSEKRDALRAERQAARAERRAEKAESRADRTEAAQRARQFILKVSERVLATGPILAPMAVAWTGQSQFAVVVLGWAFIASILYAAAYELTTVYWAWLYHQARSDGDSGLDYRIGTWVFAIGAAVQQWWHYSDNWHATPRSVTYSVMSAVGVLMWEGRAKLIHRRKLRAEGKQPPARPKIGTARWVRYPVRSWTAWSLITLQGHETLNEAWTAAEEHLRSKKADRADRQPLDRTAESEMRTAHTARAPRTADQSVRTGPDRLLADGPDRKALPGPDRIAAKVDQPVHGPDQAKRADRTKAADHAETPNGPDRPIPVDTPRSTVDRALAQPSGPDQGAGPDRTTAPLVLNETEQQALDILRTTARSISKRSIADVVRNELGRTIGSDRANEIARHYRTLRSAA